MIEKLTPAQEALIPVYREKWRSIALSTEPIDREKAAKAVEQAYALMGLDKPEIIFCDSPNVALIVIAIAPQMERLGNELRNRIHSQLQFQLLNQLINQLDSQLRSKLWIQLYNQLNQLTSELNEQLYNQLDEQLDEQLESNFSVNFIEYEKGATYCSWFDFCISVLSCIHAQSEWSVFQSLVKNCGWIFPFEKTCIICDRPRILSFDNQQRLHAEGKPAIQFADGYNLWAYHGVTLPEKYGKVHPNQWQASWLLEEDNAELRRVLIQGIGYERIAQELQATELDSFQEYALLKIENHVEIEQIYMLKMTCPSTEFIHVLRVPPGMESALEAICWVNWGIAPKEFGVQT